MICSMTFAIPLQCSTSQAIRLRGSWSFSEFMITHLKEVDGAQYNEKLLSLNCGLEHMVEVIIAVINSI